MTALRVRSLVTSCESIHTHIRALIWPHMGGGVIIDSIFFFGGGRTLSFDISILSRGPINSQPTPIFVNKHSSFALPELAFVTRQTQIKKLPKHGFPGPAMEGCVSAKHPLGSGRLTFVCWRRSISGDRKRSGVPKANPTLKTLQVQSFHHDLEPL